MNLMISFRFLLSYEFNNRENLEGNLFPTEDKRGGSMNKPKVIVDGALLLAIYSILLFFTIFIPVLGIISIFLLPIPFVIYTYRYNISQTIVFFLGACFLSFLFSSLFGLGVTFMFGMTGIVIGRLVQQKKSGVELLLGGTVSYLITSVILYAGTIAIFDLDFNNLIQESTADTISMFENTMELTGQDSDLIVEQLQQSLEIFPYLLPSSLVITSLFLAFISQLLYYPVIKRLKIPVSRLPKFRDLVLPKSLLWYYLIVLFLTFLELEPGSFLYMAVINLFYVLQLLMIIQGLSFIYYFCYIKRIPIFVPIFLTVIAPFLLYIIRILGIIDLGFHLRQRIKSKS